MQAAHSHSSRGVRLFSAVGLIAAIALGAVGFAALASLRPAPSVSPPPKKTYNVDVFVAHKACLRETISGFGTARPDREVTLSAQVAGEVLEHNLKIGQAVTGEVVFLKIDPRIYEQRLEQVKRQLAEGDSELRRLKQEQVNASRLLAKAKSDYVTATEQYERTRTLNSRNLVTPDELARALLELRQYEEAVIRQENEAGLYPLKIDQVEKKQTTTKSALEMAELDTEHTKVAAPFAGIISEVFAETGQYVRVGDPLIRITNTNLVEIPVSIKLSDYAKLAPLLRAGEFPSVKLARDVTATAEWTGRLARIAPKADEQNRTIEVFVEVDNEKQSTPLLPGTFVQARIEGPALENVFAVPRDAIINNHILIVKADGSAPVLQKRIEPIDTLQNLAILDSGLDDGDQLILTNLDVLYRDPSKTIALSDTEDRVLSINQKHDLPEFLESQTQALITIQDCAGPAGGNQPTSADMR